MGGEQEMVLIDGAESKIFIYLKNRVEIEKLEVMRGTTHLIIDCCSNLKEMEEIETLKEVDIHGCPKLDKLPLLKNLEALNLTTPLKIEIPEFPKLKRLRINNLKELPRFKLLESLTLEYYQGEDLNVIRDLYKINSLALDCCDKLIKIPAMDNDIYLFEIFNCNNIEEIGRIRSIGILKIFNCSKLKKLPETNRLKKLEIDMVFFENIEYI